MRALRLTSQDPASHITLVADPAGSIRMEIRSKVYSADIDVPLATAMEMHEFIGAWIAVKRDT